MTYSAVRIHLGHPTRAIFQKSFRLAPRVRRYATRTVGNQTTKIPMCKAQTALPNGIGEPATAARCAATLRMNPIADNAMKGDRMRRKVLSTEARELHLTRTS